MKLDSFAKEIHQNWAQRETDKRIKQERKHQAKMIVIGAISLVIGMLAIFVAFSFVIDALLKFVGEE